MRTGCKPAPTFDSTMPPTDLIQAIRRQIATLADVTTVRSQILELLVNCLNARKDSFEDWEKVHFSSAITALTLSIHAAKQPPHTWLERCLADLEKAITPAWLREPNYRLPDGSVRNAKHEQFADALECLRGDLISGAVSNAKVA